MIRETATATSVYLSEASPVVAPNLLEVEHLSLAVKTAEGTANLVDDVTFSIAEGEIVGLAGESGCGKSLTALAVLRLLPAGITQAGGSIRFRGTDMATLSPRELRALRGSEIAAIFQDPQESLNPAFTIGDQLRESIRVKDKSVSRQQAKQRSAELLDRVGIANARQRLDSYPHELSGGMAQRVMIALAIANRPKLLVADEPTTALDVTVQQQILTLLLSLRDDYGLSVILISHDLAVVSNVADKVAILYAGQTIETGPAAKTLRRPIHPYTQALLAAQPDGADKTAPLPIIPGSVPAHWEMPVGCRFSNRCGHVQPECVEVQTWTRLDAVTGVRCVRSRTLVLDATRVEHSTVAAPRPPRGGAPLLQVKGLTKGYERRSTLGFKVRSQVLAVDDVSFDIYPGETVGLVGESGAGKSTIGRLILGLTQPTKGSVTFDGKEITDAQKRPLSLRKDIQVVFQNPYATLDPHMRVEETIAEPVEAQRRLSRAARRTLVDDLLAQVGLPSSIADRYPYGLSGGQRQRVAIARALACEPRLIVCDEAVSALDVSTQAQVINLLRRLQEERDLAYLFVSHDLAVVYHVSDRIAVMRNGRLVEIGPAGQVFHEPREEYTRQLLASRPAAASGP